jgi:hypothetical protein
MRVDFYQQLLKTVRRLVLEFLDCICEASTLSRHVQDRKNKSDQRFFNVPKDYLFVGYFFVFWKEFIFVCIFTNQNLHALPIHTNSFKWFSLQMNI